MNYIKLKNISTYLSKDITHELETRSETKIKLWEINQILLKRAKMKQYDSHL